MKAKLNAPMPFCAARWMVSRRLHATHTGGCGFCRGLGTTLRGGIVTYLPWWPVNGSSVMQRTATRRPSSHISRFSIGSIRKPPSSASDDDSPVPKSTRPPDTRSSVEMRSAIRAGWLNAGGVWTMPWPRRICLVRCDTAARNTSGALEWLYSSRKWCSTSQQCWIPSLSASSHCSNAFCSSVYSESSSQGRGSWCS
jgi:hypothetical protein